MVGAPLVSLSAMCRVFACFRGGTYFGVNTSKVYIYNIALVILWYPGNHM